MYSPLRGIILPCLDVKKDFVFGEDKVSSLLSRRQNASGDMRKAEHSEFLNVRSFVDIGIANGDAPHHTP